jgi:hypothetical protein
MGSTHCTRAANQHSDSHGEHPLSAAATALGPKSAPDEVSIRRLRRILVDHFDEQPTLDRHIAMLDARGVRYAGTAVQHWGDTDLAMFFAVVRHVIRTQSTEGSATPDIEGWLAAGQPADPEHGNAWHFINAVRYPSQAVQEPVQRSQETPEIAEMDRIVTE